MNRVPLLQLLPQFAQDLPGLRNLLFQSEACNQLPKSLAGQDHAHTKFSVSALKVGWDCPTSVLGCDDVRDDDLKRSRKAAISSHIGSFPQERFSTHSTT
jgi:hypothetical protein